MSVSSWEGRKRCSINSILRWTVPPPVVNTYTVGVVDRSVQFEAALHHLVRVVGGVGVGDGRLAYRTLNDLVSLSL